MLLVLMEPYVRTVIRAGVAANKTLALSLGRAWSDVELLIDILAKEDLGVIRYWVNLTNSSIVALVDTGYVELHEHAPRPVNRQF